MQHAEDVYPELYPKTLEVRVDFTYGISTVTRIGPAVDETKVADTIRHLKQRTESDTHGTVDVHRVEVREVTHSPWRPFPFNRRDFF